MTLPEIQNALSSLLYLHPTSATNVEAVENVGTDIHFVTDASELQEQIKELTEDRDEAMKNCEATDKKAEALEAQRDTLQAVLAEIKGPDGVSLTTFIERTEQAEKDADDAQARATEFHRIQRETERECTALRSRKGISANLFRQQSEILHVLGQMATYPDDRARWQPRAKELLAKLHER